MADGFIVRRGGKAAAELAPIYTAATGGTTEEYNLDGKRYRSHTFTSNDTFEVTTAGNGDRNQVDYLIIAGGGGGGGSEDNDNGDGGGGGGAGGYITSFGTSGRNSDPAQKLLVTEKQYTISIGAGGGGGILYDRDIRLEDLIHFGSVGSPSQFDFLVSIGGGGGSFGRAGNGLFGGSGGGAGGFCNTNRSGGSGLITQGFNGGNSTTGCSGVRRRGAGGGGAGSNGVSVSTTASVTPNGGNGLENILRTGSAETRAGGGGGGAGGGTGTNPWIGLGQAGGGNGGIIQSNGQNGTANTGGGGGGGGASSRPTNAGNGGNGGSGIVVIRYEIAPTT